MKMITKKINLNEMVQKLKKAFVSNVIDDQIIQTKLPCVK